MADERRLIEVNALMEKIRLMANRTSFGEMSPSNISGIEVCGLILDAPAVDAVEVVHGQWELHANGSATCSVCHRTTLYAWDFDNAFNYCPHCGAKMDGGADNGKWKADD